MRNPTRKTITATLRRMARPTASFDAARYFRGCDGLRFYNVPTPQIRALARQIHEANRAHWALHDAMRLADELIRDPHLEAKAVAVEAVARYRRGFTPSLLAAWKRWLANGHAANWATTDAVCSYLIGPLLLAHPELVAEVRVWSNHRSLWVRRASAVALIPSIRRGLALDAAFAVADSLIHDEEDLIQKAVGWMLRETTRRDATRVEQFLLSRRSSVPRTTVRYAIERFPAARRLELLALTRGRP
jgi:3-methyladenine DNA glycosylase AlkD